MTVMRKVCESQGDNVSELENLIRQIVREEIRLYLKEFKNDEMPVANSEDPEESTPDKFDYELFEQKYQAALKIDNEVNERYQSQIDQHGATIKLGYAADLLKMSQYALRKLAKTDSNFPTIFRGQIGTARLLHWLDGGKAYWKLSENDD